VWGRRGGRSGAGGGPPTRPPPEAGEIGELAYRFLGAYLTSTSPADLSYYLAPEAEVRPLGGGFALQAAPTVAELEGLGPERTVLASGNVTDEASGVTYPLAYRLELVKRERWYVAGLKGALR
jgi:hypothetical protein